MLADAVGALQGDGTPAIDPDDTALAAALPVIHELVLQLSELVRTRLPEAEQEAFMHALRVQVAGAVRALAEEEAPGEE